MKLTHSSILLVSFHKVIWQRPVDGMVCEYNYTYVNNCIDTRTVVTVNIRWLFEIQINLNMKNTLMQMVEMHWI